MEIKKLAKNTAILASPKILKFFIGLVKTKFIAIFLGVTGLGIIDQLVNTINQIRQLSLSFLPDGMVKLIAQENANEKDENKIGAIIKTYFIMVIPLAIVVTMLGYTYADEITKYIFGDIKYKTYFKIGFIALPITIFSASFHSFLKAYKDIKSIAYVEIIVVIINIIIFVPLVYYYKIPGGVVYATLSFFVNFLVVYIVVKKRIFQKYKITFLVIKNAVFSKKYSKELFAFISAGVVAGMFSVFEDISVRAIVVNQLGIDQLGIYNPITKWGGLFIGFILPSVYTYLYPRLSEAKDDEEIIGVINDVIRLLTFIILPCIIIGITTRIWIIPLFYSSEFMDATIYLPFHFSALLIVVWATILEQIFAPSGRLKFYLLFLIIFKSISLVMVFYLVPIIGLYGYMMRFTIIPILTIIAYLIFWKKNINLKIKKENLTVMFYSMICVVIMLLLKDQNSYIQLISLLLILPLYFMLNKEEKKFLSKKIRAIRMKLLRQ